ncbi:CMRF35-like molecule 7 isoform 2-T2 [Dama dama]|uniref:CMRF35-like molecule 7 isoform X2 n=1 Tax=Dama dama TaxID=30532 RepID=UPI002A368193|nr:CMRF35-like molecule 7 isoform X2 [Dama dama]
MWLPPALLLLSIPGCLSIRGPESVRGQERESGSGREEKGDRVSIKDDQRNRSFTVTLQELRQDDADTYWCGIEKPGTDLGTQIKVTVVPRSQASRTRNTSRPAASSRPHSRTHYMLLAFLKMPFLLGLVGAVLWLEERRRDVVEPQGQPIYANLSSELLTRDTRV